MRCAVRGMRRASTSMLSGLLSVMGMQITRTEGLRFCRTQGAARARAMKRAQKMAKNDYQGARGTRFALFPGFGSSQKHPAMGDEHRTSGDKLPVGRYSAEIDPAWAEPSGRIADAHHIRRPALVGFSWFRSGECEGAIVRSADRTRTVPCNGARINPLEARDFLIRQGLGGVRHQQRFSTTIFVTKNRDISRRGRRRREPHPSDGADGQ